MRCRLAIWLSRVLQDPDMTSSRFTIIISLKTEDENTEVIDRIAELAAWLARNSGRKRGLNPDKHRCPDEVAATDSFVAALCLADDVVCSMPESEFRHMCNTIVVETIHAWMRCTLHKATKQQVAHWKPYRRSPEELRDRMARVQTKLKAIKKHSNCTKMKPGYIWVAGDKGTFMMKKSQLDSL